MALIQELGSTNTYERTSTMRSISSITIVVILILNLYMVSAKTNKNFLRYVGYLNFINDHRNHVLLQTPVHARLLICLNC